MSSPSKTYAGKKPRRELIVYNKTLFLRKGYEIINPKPAFVTSPSASGYMALASWLCANNSKSMVVKIIYPGGRVELHDRPILAAEIMQRHPRCCVTHPDVFCEPSAVVSPDTVLMLGQKFYVVPISTLRKLQRHSIRNPRSLRAEFRSPQHKPRSQHHLNSHQSNAGTTKKSSGCLKQWEVELGDSSSGGSRSFSDEMVRRVHKLEDGCFKCWLAISKTKPEEAATDERTRENSPTRMVKNAPPMTPACHWRPSLDSISEE